MQAVTEPYFPPAPISDQSWSVSTSAQNNLLLPLKGQTPGAALPPCFPLSALPSTPAEGPARLRGGDGPAPDRDVSEEQPKERHGGPAHAPASPPAPFPPGGRQAALSGLAARWAALGRSAAGLGRGGRGGARGTYPARGDGGSPPRPCSSGSPSEAAPTASPRHRPR